MRSLNGILFFCFFLLGLSSSSLLLKNFSLSLPSLKIGSCPSPLPNPQQDWSKLNLATISEFTLDSGHGIPQQNTTVRFCWTEDYLIFKYDLVDNNIYNPYTHCNDHLYEYDVVECFLSHHSNDTSPIHHYIELEVSPTNALFASHIDNPNLTCNGITGNLINCSLSGIFWEAKVEEKGWWAYLKVPFSLIDKEPPKSRVGSVYRINLFRIDTALHGNKEYSCWSSTFSDPPCFHKPNYFGYIGLV